MQTQYLRHDDYTIGWICAISVEFQAALLMLDEKHSGVFPQLPGSDAVYGAGRIGDHNIVIACLPEQKTGNVAAAGLMTQVKMSFRNLRYALMVGIAAGCPGPNGLNPDVRLGDVVVAFPTDKSSGIVGYELGKETVDGFLKRQDNSYRMDQTLLNTISSIRNNFEVDGTHEFLEHLNISSLQALGKRKRGEETAYQNHIASKFEHPALNGHTDILYTYDTNETINRPPRPNPKVPTVLYGAIASGDKVVKNARQREDLRERYGVLCIEMEAAGLRDSYPAAIIRGIGDYADSHKNDQWQPYAAFVAAAYAKGVIHRIPPALEDQHRRGLNFTQAHQNYRTSQSCPGIPKERAEISDEVRQACLESLSFEQIDARLADIKKPHIKTCEWLYQKQEYKNWLDKDFLEEHHGFLWLKGKPGAGKSTIMKHTLNSKTMGKATTISFFFNARGSTLEKSTLGMYRSLLHQLLRKIPSLQDDFASVYLEKNKSSNGDIDWAINELQDHLEKVIAGLQQQQRLVFFVDALDECESDEVRDMVDFFQSLGETAVSQQKSLNICFASRHYPHISIEKCIELIVESQEGHENDIEKYVKSKLGAQKGKAMDRVRAEILRKASGVFLWVVLVVNILRKECDKGMTHKISKKLDEIPAGLDDLFADILSRGEATGVETTLCLQWLLFSKRSLSPEELYFAILFGSDPAATKEWNPDDKESNEETVKRFILSCSKGLAEESKSKAKRVQFIHETVRDFFLLRNGLAKVDPSLQANVDGFSDDQLKHCCYECIMTDRFDDIFKTPLPKAKSPTMKDLREKVLSQMPFLDYAVHNIFKHADSAEQNNVTQNIFLATFNSPEKPDFQTWKNVSNIFEIHKVRRYLPEVKLLYVLSEHNVPNLVKALLPRLSTSDIDAIAGHHGTAVNTASYHGHAKVVQLLINAGANIHFSVVLYSSALEGALCKGHAAVADILLRRDTHKEVYKEGKTPLHYTVKLGWTTLVERILEYPDVKLDVKDKFGRTPLFIAANEGHEAVTHLLLERGADVNARGSIGYMILQQAASMGNDKIVQLLLDKGADVNAQSETYGNALYAASQNMEEKVVQLLLDRGANINATGGFYGNALQAACTQSGNEVMVQLLLDNGADVNAQSGHCGNALQAACAQSGNEVAVQLLLDNRANVNSQGGYFGNALQAASFKGNEKIVQLLLDRGADVNKWILWYCANRSLPFGGEKDSTVVN